MFTPFMRWTSRHVIWNRQDNVCDLKLKFNYRGFHRLAVQEILNIQLFIIHTKCKNPDMPVAKFGHVPDDHASGSSVLLVLKPLIAISLCLPNSPSVRDTLNYEAGRLSLSFIHWQKPNLAVEAKLNSLKSTIPRNSLTLVAFSSSSEIEAKAIADLLNIFEVFA